MACKPASIDLNRALPKPPVNEHLPTSTESPSRRRVSSSEDERHNTIRPLQQASAKKQLQSVTHKLLTQGSPPNVYWTQRDVESVDPVKFSPPEGDRKSPVMAKPSSHYQEQRVARLEDLLRYSRELTESHTSPNVPRYQPTKYQHKPKGMSHSISENNMSFRRPPGYKQMAFEETQQHVDPDDADCQSMYSQELPSFVHSRGRPIPRTPSPIKTLEDIREDQTPEYIRDQSPRRSMAMGPPASPIKRSRSPMKQLFGERGILGRSASMKELPSDENRKKGVKHFVEKLNQRVGGMVREVHLRQRTKQLTKRPQTEGVSKLIPSSISHGELSKLIPTSLSNRESPSKGSSPPPTSKFPVSLNPPEQAKFYSEAELMICATANKYLLTQHSEGRMSYDSIKKITDVWAQKNRPQVIEFQFDQLTQRDLILYNLKTFRFYGPNAENLVSMHGMMHSWKTLAREMSIRTFCTGDSTIRKQIQDIYKILEMLGAPMVMFLAFQQIQIRTLKRMRDMQRMRDEVEAQKIGVERKWEPPGGFPVAGGGQRGSAESEAWANPFVDCEGMPTRPAASERTHVYDSG
ncbi:MAG: hypothetical protein Q9209_004540 [Squamulea sp. 1 TL-2023]